MALVPSVGGAYWAIKEQWSERDPRRARIARQEIPPTADSDIITTFPATVRAEDVVAWIDRHYGSRTSVDSTKDAQRVTEATEQRLATTQAAKVERFTNEVVERGAKMTMRDRRLIAGAEAAHPMVAGFGEKPARGRKKAAPKTPSTE